MFKASPFVAPEAEIEAAWIDYNGHMNMAYYNVLFDRAADHAFASLGMTEDFVKSHGLSFFVAEAHVCYLRELHQGSLVTASFHLLDHDEKRLHVYGEIVHSEGWTAATTETLYLHIDASGPKVAPIPAAVFSRVKEMRLAHAALAYPERAGRQIKIKRS
ncbi:MAG: thioesterase family protein [Pseudomonadota bacterium]